MTADSGKVTRRYRIDGKVQGVFFRQSTRSEAYRLGIRGSVRNLADGSVEVVAHGPAAVIDELYGWLHHGPARARVDGVSELPLGEASIPDGFDIG